MIIMSVDYGDKRTGIAICDKLEMLASPVCVITEWNAATPTQFRADAILQMSIVQSPKDSERYPSSTYYLKKRQRSL